MVIDAKFKPNKKEVNSHHSRQILITSAVLLCTLFVVMTGCTRLDESLVVSDSLPPSPDMELFTALITRQNGDAPLFDLKAGKMYTYAGKSSFFLENGLKVDFFDNTGSHTAILTAASGEIQEQTTWMVARGGVIVHSDSGYVLRTEYLLFDPKMNKVVSDSFVTFLTPFDSLTGYGFTSTPDLKEWTLKNSSGTTYRQPVRKKAGRE